MTFATNEKPIEPTINQDEIDEFLDELREGGSINMFASPPLIEQAFGVSKREARQAFMYWADNFSS